MSSDISAPKTGATTRSHGADHHAFLPLVLISVLAVCCMGSVAQPASAADSAGQQLLQSGQSLLAQHCSVCHAIGANDESRYRQAPAFRNLSQKYQVALLEEALAEGIMTGHPDMPEFEFEVDEIDAIIAYLESIQTGGQAKE